MRIHVKKSARKELLKLPDNILIKAFKIILSLSENPYPRGYDKVEGKENQLRLWIDKNYRILYEVTIVIKTVWTLLLFGLRVRERINNLQWCFYQVARSDTISSFRTSPSA